MKEEYNEICSKGAIPEFIMKIYSILEVPSESTQKNQFEDIICWSQNCSEIHIKSPKALEDEVLPVYFRHRKIESFIRQLNMYRFSKVNKLNKEKHHMFFKNELFRKGNMYDNRLFSESLSMIKRKKKGHVEETVDTSEDNEAESLENYKDFVRENVYLIQEELLKVRKFHPEMTAELVKAFQYSNVIVGQEPNFNAMVTSQDIRTKHNLFQTYKQLFQLNSIRNFNSRCSIDSQIHQQPELL